MSSSHAKWCIYTDKRGSKFSYFPIFEWISLSVMIERESWTYVCTRWDKYSSQTHFLHSSLNKMLGNNWNVFFFLSCQNAEKVAGHLSKAEQTHTKHQISFFWHNITLCSYWSIKRKEESRYTCITSCWRMKRSIRSWTRLWDPSCTSADHEPEHTRVPSPSASATLLSSNKAFEAMHK